MYFTSRLLFREEAYLEKKRKRMEGKGFRQNLKLASHVNYIKALV